ncbi:MAG: hypothetical protein CME70_22890 [Halobacteriovorax sp.]|nr:hypothetical protein [Halobacteriovorax sp.]|tara:strand:- start:2183 stop:2878 length:696 start_codon:yes stop_codon:yes gene_type:complete
MIQIRVPLLGLLFLFTCYSNLEVLASEKPALKESKESLASRKREPKYHYGYTNRPHTLKESALHLSAIYGLSWALYPITQPEVFREKGSIKNYRYNFGRLVFDRDEPFWNWFVHPITGSQLYLYYRANGYNRVDSLGMAFISSTLFEFTVEIYTEPASVQDLYQTPVIGSVIGLGLENLSLYLLNTGNAFGRFLGHVLNPSTLFWFYEGKIQLIPKYNGKKTGSLTLMMDF